MSKRLKNLARTLFYKPLIKARWPLSAKVSFAGRKIVFHDVASSQITEDILLKGFEEYEYELNKFICLYDRPLRTFIDAGANIGYYSVLARSHFGKDVQVFAIEPFPNNIAYLERLKKTNALDFNIVPHALAEKSGVEKIFYVPKTHRSSRFAASGSLINSFKGTGGIYHDTDYDEIRVTTVTLGSVLELSPGPTLLKIDVEGYELPVLKTIESELRTREDFDLVVEIMINDADKNDLFSFLTNCGYEGYLITNAGLVYEDRPLTLPYHNSRGEKLRTCWKNHFFTKRPRSEVEQFGKKNYGYVL